MFTALHLADRCHNSRRAAGKGFAQTSAFGVGVPLLDRIGLFAHRQAHVAPELDEGVAGNARQDRSGQRRRLQGAVVKDEEDVHAAKLLDPALFNGIEEDHLIAALTLAFSQCGKASGIVAAALGSTRAPRSSAGEILGNPERDGRSAALEEGSDRRSDDAIEVIGRRLCAERDFRTDQERPEIKR